MIHGDSGGRQTASVLVVEVIESFDYACSREAYAFCTDRQKRRLNVKVTKSALEICAILLPPDT